MREEHYRKLYNLIKLAFIDMQNLVNKSEDEHKYIFRGCKKSCVYGE